MDVSIHHSDDFVLFRNLLPDVIQHLINAAMAQNHWEEIVPGLDSLALKFDPVRVSDQQITSLLNALQPEMQNDKPPIQRANAAGRRMLKICYDAGFGPDQSMIAEALGISIEDLADWHKAQNWRVAILGFLPGFAYLTCDSEFPEIPRLTDPRAHVPAGSVGILGAQCGIYALDGPGGWPLIGRVADPLFDVTRHPPALLAAGVSVEFSAISRQEFDLQASQCR